MQNNFFKYICYNLETYDEIRRKLLTLKINLNFNFLDDFERL